MGTVRSLPWTDDSCLSVESLRLSRGFSVAKCRVPTYGRSMTTSTEAHTIAMHKEIHELIAELLKELGPTVIQVMTGTRDRSMPSRWAREDGPRPRSGTEQQLRLGYRVWMMMRDEETAQVAAAWMMGANPQLGEDTPLTAIREGRAGEVVGAATAFSTGMFAG